MDYQKLASSKGKASLIEPTNYSFKQFYKLAVDITLGIAEIRIDDPSESKKIMPIIDDDEALADKGSQNLSTTKESQNEADIEANHIDEDFAFVDDDIWETLVNPWTLFFRSYKKEDAYYRTALLPNRVLLLRLTTALILIVLLINISTLQDVPFGSTVWTISIVLNALFFILTWWEKGKYYIDFALESKQHRICLMALEMSAISILSLFDFTTAGYITATDGACAFIVASYFSISCGLSSTYIEASVGLILVTIVAVAKLIVLADGHPEDPVLACVVYGLPILMNAVVMWGLFYPTDQLRRLRYLKTLCIETQLAQMKQERLKTDYLLSLSLPKSIVSKLRDQMSFGLIVEKFPNACVMFGDLKNFKDVAHKISMREAVIMLNGVFEHIDDLLDFYPTLEKIKTITSKILLVGGIGENNENFLEEMSELALDLLEYFSEAKEYDVENETIEVKLDMGFGIAYGPIVAGIVGKKKFVYEIYGDVVNTSSRMCSLAKGNDIVVTEKCYQLLDNEYICSYLGDKYVKGKGEIPVYNVTGIKERPADRERVYHSDELLSTVQSKGLKSTLSQSFGNVAKAVSESIESLKRIQNKKLQEEEQEEVEQPVKEFKPLESGQLEMIKSVETLETPTPDMSAKALDLLIREESEEEKQQSQQILEIAQDSPQENESAHILNQQSRVDSPETIEQDRIVNMENDQEPLLENPTETPQEPEQILSHTSIPIDNEPSQQSKDTEVIQIDSPKQPENQQISQEEEESKDVQKSLSFHNLSNTSSDRKQSSTGKEERKLKGSVYDSSDLGSKTGSTPHMSSAFQERRASRLVGMSEARQDAMRDFGRRRASIIPQQVLDFKMSSDMDVKEESDSDSDKSKKSSSKSSIKNEKRLADAMFKSMDLDTKKDKTRFDKDGGIDVSKLGNAVTGKDKEDDKKDKEKKMRKFNENSEEAKDVVIDIIMRLIKKVGGKGKKTLEKYLKEISKEMQDFSLKFKQPILEAQFRLDFTIATTWAFLRSTLQVLLVEMLMLFLASFNTVKLGHPVLGNKTVFILVMCCAVAGLGLQMFVSGVTVFAAADEEPSPDFTPRMIQFYISLFTLTITTVMITLPWSNLAQYEFLVGGIIVHVFTFMIIRMDGVLFIYKLVAAIALGLGYLIYQHVIEQTYWYITLSIILLFPIWAAAFHRSERSTRIEYLIDAIMETQADLVADEILKSSTVLHSILPQLVIDKLLEEPNSICYEDFKIISVLQLDIAGFTAMSSTLEPSVILEMLNTLFTYFDHLTEEFNVEKITTIGDAYVACSSFHPNANPKTGAISICLVGLQMQAYLSQQLNESEFVKKNVGSAVRMRVGIHTGPAVGAIMGGPKNFRYDLLGDTVTIAEKIQEIAPVGHVNISQSTYEQVKDYHGFSFHHTSELMYNGKPTYVLKAFDERLATHGSELDISAPLKSTQAAQEAAKIARAPTGMGRKGTMTSGQMGKKTNESAANMAKKANEMKEQQPGKRLSLNAGNALARAPSFNAIPQLK